MEQQDVQEWIGVSMTGVGYVCTAKDRCVRGMLLKNVHCGVVEDATLLLGTGDAECYLHIHVYMCDHR